MKLGILGIIGVGASPAAYFYTSFETCLSKAPELLSRPDMARHCSRSAERNGVLGAYATISGETVEPLCKLRASFEAYSRLDVPGLLVEDRIDTLIKAGNLDEQCKFILISLVGCTDRAGELLDRAVTARTLAKIVAIHENGFPIALDAYCRSLEENGYMRIVPVYTDPLILPSEELAVLGMFTMKRDLLSFVYRIESRFNDESLIRDFRAWLLRLRIDRRDVPKASEYAEWISRFERSTPSRKRKVSQEPSRKRKRTFPKIKTFNKLYDECLEEYERLEDIDCIHPNAKVTLESVGQVEVLKRLTGGANGEVWTTTNPDVLIKVSPNDSSFCNERSVLAVLEGLHGGIPSLFTVVDPRCNMIAMTRVGTQDWPAPGDEIRPSPKHVSDIIRIVRDLHEAGFLHSDIHHENVRMDSDHAYLIDFEMTSSIPPPGSPRRVSRARDLNSLVGEVITPYVPGGLEMYADMDLLDDDDRPDYEKWITYFDNLGKATEPTSL